MNANQNRRSAAQSMSHCEEDLPFRAFQVDQSWYQTYWYDEPRPVRVSRLTKSFKALSAFVGKLLDELGRVRRVAAESPPDLSPYLGPADVALARRLVKIQSRAE